MYGCGTVGAMPCASVILATYYWVLSDDKTFIVLRLWELYSSCISDDCLL